MKKNVRNKIYKLMMDIDPYNFLGKSQENESIAQIFGYNSERANRFVVDLKIVELIVATECSFGIKIEKDYGNIFFMKLKDFVDYVFYMT